MKLYDRYIMLETLQVLAVGTFAIIGIFYGTAEFKNVLDMTTASGLSLQTVLLIMVLQLPTGMVCCLPSGVVMAVMLVLIRSSRDCEVMALQLLGVPLLRVSLFLNMQHRSVETLLVAYLSLLPIKPSDLSLIAQNCGWKRSPATEEL
jgi:lipopolysaccharide export LptBFGC system permease protein LptF